MKKQDKTLERKRQAQKEAGTFDGRFRTKKVKDKKKFQSQKACKKKIDEFE